MKLLMLSTDQKIFETGSAVRERMIDYGSMVEELHIVIKVQSSKFKVQNFGNVFVYPINTSFKPFYFLDAYRIGKSVIRNWKLDIRKCAISAQDPFETGLVGYLLKKKFGLPLQLQIHTDFLSPYFWQESLKNKIRVLLAKWLIKKADGVRVVSERIKKSLITKFPNYQLPITVLPIFFDKQKFEQAAAKSQYGDDFLILTVARLEPEKNLFLALEAAARVLRDYPHTRYVIIGSGSLESKFLNKIKFLQMGDRIEIKQVAAFELPSWYRRANLFLLTSNYEGYGLAAVEAAAAHIPVVMTDVGVALGKVVPVGHKDALIQALRDLIIDERSRQELVVRESSFFHNWPSKKIYLQAIRESWEKSCL